MSRPRDRWDEFTKLKYAMLKRTHAPLIALDHSSAPTTSRQRALNAFKTILNAVDYDDKDTDLDFCARSKDRRFGSTGNREDGSRPSTHRQIQGIEAFLSRGLITVFNFRSRAIRACARPPRGRAKPGRVVTLADEYIG